MITMPVSARIPPHWISAVDGSTMIIPMPARSSRTQELYSVFMDMRTRELKCDCRGFRVRGRCFHVNWLIRACYKRRRTKGVQDSSLEAYFSLAPEVLAERQREIYLVLRDRGPLTDRQLAELLGRERHTIPARRNELLDDGLVQDAGRVLDPVSNITVHLWGATA